MAPWDPGDMASMPPDDPHGQRAIMASIPYIRGFRTPQNGSFWDPKTPDFGGPEPSFPGSQDGLIWSYRDIYGIYSIYVPIIPYIEEWIYPYILYMVYIPIPTIRGYIMPYTLIRGS